jgi:hypothetical protein
MSSDPTNSLASVDTGKLIVEVLSRIDSICQAISHSGQTRPISIQSLGSGWGDMVDMHLFAARDKPIRQRVQIGKHLVSNCIKLYLLQMDDTHRLAHFRPLVNAMATAYAHFVRKDDAEATQAERDESNKYAAELVQMFTSDVLPWMFDYLSGGPQSAVESVLSSVGVDETESGLGSLLSMWRK